MSTERYRRNIMRDYLNEHIEEVVDRSIHEIRRESVAAISRYIERLRKLEEELDITIDTPILNSSSRAALDGYILAEVGSLNGLPWDVQVALRSIGDKQLEKQAMIWIGIDPNSVPKE